VTDVPLEGDGRASDSFAKAANRRRFWNEISMVEEMTKVEDLHK
jgi:hypothetical protein